MKTFSRYSLINESIDKNKNILKLIDRSSEKSTNDVKQKIDENDQEDNKVLDSFSYEDEEEEAAAPPSSTKQQSTSITSENFINNNNANLNNHDDEMMTDDIDENLPQNVNIPLEMSSKPISDPRLSNPRYLNRNDGLKDLLKVNYSAQNQATETVKESEIMEQKQPVLNLPANPPSLLSLNLPSSISSILFQVTNTITPKPTIENNLKPTAINLTNRDPRIKAHPINKTTIKTENNITQTPQNIQNKQSPPKNPNPIFNKIQQVIKEGFTNQNQMKKQSKNVYVIENNGVRISRTKPAPNYVDESDSKSQLVKLYEAEPFEHDFTRLIKEKTDWIIVNKANRLIKNHRLQNLIQNRNQCMINKMGDEIMNELNNNENDLINDLKMLMNYDFCNNKHMIKKKKATDKSTKKKNLKTEIRSNVLTDLIVDLVNENDNNLNLRANEIDNDDDLYGDLNNIYETHQETEEDNIFFDNLNSLENKINTEDKQPLKKEKVNLNDSDTKENKIKNNNTNNVKIQQNENKYKDERKVSNIENNNRKYEKNNNYKTKIRRSRSRSNSRKRSRSNSRNRLDSKRTYSNDSRSNYNKKRHEEDDNNRRSKNLSPFRDSSKYSSNSSSKSSYKNNEDKNSKRIRTD